MALYGRTAVVVSSVCGLDTDRPVPTLTFRSRHFVQDSSCLDCGAFLDRSPATLCSTGSWTGVAAPYPPYEAAAIT